MNMGVVKIRAPSKWCLLCCFPLISTQKGYPRKKKETQKKQKQATPGFGSKCGLGKALCGCECVRESICAVKGEEGRCSNQSRSRRLPFGQAGAASRHNDMSNVSCVPNLLRQLVTLLAYRLWCMNILPQVGLSDENAKARLQFSSSAT